MAKLTKEEIIEAIKEMSILEVKELVKACEEEFGVSAAAVAVAAAPAAGGDQGAAAQEKSEYEVVLKSPLFSLVDAGETYIVNNIRRAFVIDASVSLQRREAADSVSGSVSRAR